MRSLLQRLIAEERLNGNDPDSRAPAAFRVCEKLRRPLTVFAGVAGFRSLLSRALVLAKEESPLLEGVKIKPDGTFQYSAEFEAQIATEAAAKAGAALADRLIGLLVIFIGEALMLRLVHDVWPKAALKDSKSGGK
jgi:hypothetical protein